EVNYEIVGIATMCNYRVISGNKGWIEDVVVDAAARGKGVGLKMVEKLIEIAKEKGLSEVLLFTEQHRAAAISLYGKLGFTAKDSQIYHFLIG
ncbi:MAG: N-acetyltransferase family protein, partial [Cytophagales bacterium]